MKFILPLFLFISCGHKTVDQTPSPKMDSKEEKVIQAETSNTAKSSCLCPQMWLPVCGKNGRTYSNSCYAKCAHEEFRQGSCEDISAE